MGELLAVIAFTVVMGTNDGASIVAVNGPSRGIGALGSSLVLSGSLVAVPLVVGWDVASTVALRLVAFGAPEDRTTFLAAVVVAMAVVFGLSRKGLPTSLTLALVGGIVGSGIGSGLPVRSGLVLIVLAIGAAAPILAGATGFVMHQAMSLLSSTRIGPRTLRVAHVAIFTAQAAAYGANDGQKAFAVLAILVGTPGSSTLSFTPSTLIGLGVLFWIGTILGVKAIRGGIGRRLAPERTHHSITAQLASAVSVGAGAVFSAPVSMTQASAASLVGSAAAESRRRVRWDQVARIGQAWILTLPTAAALGIAVGAIIGAQS